MNKKVSTIFAMAALAGGVFCGSAYAQETVATPIEGTALTTVKAGDVVMLKDNGDNILGFVQKGTATDDAVISATGRVTKADVLRYTWVVRQAAKSTIQQDDYYIFENAVTGDTLAFRASDQSFFIPNANSSTVADRYASKNYFMFTYGSATPSISGYDGSGKAFYAVNENGRGTNFALTLTAGTDAVSGKVSLNNTTPASTFTLHKASTAAADVHELNDLYNGKGFNLGVRPALTSTNVVEGNLFDSAEQTIWAFQVNITNSDGTTGYKLPTNQGSTGNVLYVPNGVYFFANPVFLHGKGAADYKAGNLDASDIDWLNSTLVALSPTETLEATDVNRADGAGFKLITEKGTNFIFVSNTSEPQGDDLYITNACFTVQTNFDASYPYAISLNDFYYQKTANYKGTDKQTTVAAYLGVSSYNNTEQSLVSFKGDADDAEYRFYLKASSVVDGKTLLHTSKKAAIYTVKFVSGQSDDADLMNKYLTVGNNGATWQWEAKGAAIVNTDFPIFQYVITAVDKDNYVTFTNRETGFEFTTQLFKEEGENRYSLSTSDLNEIFPYTVKTTSANTYEVEVQDQDSSRPGVQGAQYDSNIIVELQRLDNVDRYAGFLNIDNESIRTLAFARDKNDTSNKFYAVVGDEDNNTIENLSFNHQRGNDDVFVDDITSAAQWQIVKGWANSIKRVYVYNNTATESIDDVPNGDLVSAYLYSLRYVEDGTETDWYLQNNYSTLSSKPYNLDKVTDVEEYADIPSTARFYIKENVDGSVSLIEAGSAFRSGVVAAPSVEKAIEAAYNESTGVRYYDFSEDVYASKSEANNVKTYLDPKPIEISWPGKEGHVTLESELGNYINMNENRDAIVVNENDGDVYWLYVTDKDAIVPSFYITKGIGAEDGERMFLFNPVDSVSYYVAEGEYDRVYEWAEGKQKAMFKAATINESRDTLTIDVKGETKYVAKEANDNNPDIWGGVDRFKFQIIEAEDAEGYYRIRQLRADKDKLTTRYLSALNDKLTWSNKGEAMLFTVEDAAAPTANEGVSATEVKIIATDGAINVKNAAGKNVVVSTILGQIVANEVLTSDNATISVPAGIVIVSVDGEEAVKVNVK